MSHTMMLGSSTRSSKSSSKITSSSSKLASNTGSSNNVKCDGNTGCVKGLYWRGRFCCAVLVGYETIGTVVEKAGFGYHWWGEHASGGNEEEHKKHEWYTYLYPTPYHHSLHSMYIHDVYFRCSWYSLAAIWVNSVNCRFEWEMVWSCREICMKFWKESARRVWGKSKFCRWWCRWLRELWNWLGWHRPRSITFLGWIWLTHATHFFGHLKRQAHLPSDAFHFLSLATTTSTTSHHHRQRWWQRQWQFFTHISWLTCTFSSSCLRLIPFVLFWLCIDI